MIFNHPVYPIPPSFCGGELELESTEKYIRYLGSRGSKTVMSTAGTSQFNLMSNSEIREFNSTLLKFRGNKILGIPPVSEFHVFEEIEFYNSLEDKDGVYIMVLFPERFYENNQVVKFFHRICEKSDIPVLAHGNPIKRGNGGSYEYDLTLLKELKKIPNFIGIKEESSSLDFGINNIPDSGMEIIVAGGSMRRFWCMEPFGATSFLSGLGSFFPQLDEIFYSSYSNGEFEFARRVMTEVEFPVFRKFMSFGWHSCMREGLKHMGFINEDRAPFYSTSEKKKEEIVKQIDYLNEILHNWTV